MVYGGEPNQHPLQRCNRSGDSEVSNFDKPAATVHRDDSCLKHQAVIGGIRISVEQEKKNQNGVVVTNVPVSAVCTIVYLACRQGCVACCRHHDHAGPSAPFFHTLIFWLSMMPTVGFTSAPVLPANWT